MELLQSCAKSSIWNVHDDVITWKICLCVENLLVTDGFPPQRARNKSALVQAMAWCRTGNKLLSKPMLTQFLDAWCICGISTERSVKSIIFCFATSFLHFNTILEDTLTNFCNFIQNVTEVCSRGSDWLSVSIGLSNGSALNRPNHYLHHVDPVHWHISASPIHGYVITSIIKYGMKLLILS